MSDQEEDSGLEEKYFYFDEDCGTENPIQKEEVFEEKKG